MKARELCVCVRLLSVPARSSPSPEMGGTSCSFLSTDIASNASASESYVRLPRITRDLRLDRECELFRQVLLTELLRATRNQWHGGASAAVHHCTSASTLFLPVPKGKYFVMYVSIMESE
jgi:hypothetical protein